MCAGADTTSDHLYGVDRYEMEKEKFSVHIMARCANCQGNHQANSARCPRLKAKLQARQKRLAKISETVIEASRTAKSTEEEPVKPSQEIDERENWGKSPTPEFS